MNTKKPSRIKISYYPLQVTFQLLNMTVFFKLFPQQQCQFYSSTDLSELINSE
jgi:hypothetical protein